MQADQTLADEMVDNAIRMCADIKFHGDTNQTLQALQLGRCDVCGTVSECLVHKVGEYLGRMDQTVKAVYQCEPEFSALLPKPDFPKLTPRPAGINLVAWVGRKSAALTALGVTLENALSESRKRVHCKNASPACYILDIQIIEDRDVQESRGYGLVVNNMFLRSVQVWRREETAHRQAALPPKGESGEKRGIGIGEAKYYDPEILPEEILFEAATDYETLPSGEREKMEHRLREFKVALIRRLISDQLAYINIAKDWFTFEDLKQIYKRKIGYGRIGGKAAGMALAARILHNSLEEPLASSIQTPESFFLGSDLIYIFMAMNGLMHWNNQKYKAEDQIRQEYPRLRQEFLRGKFPPEILMELRGMLEKIGNHPVIVRSSSLLEDNFGTSFAGKYESHFLANQGDPDKNLEALTQAIASIYASTLKPDALLYRRKKGLQAYDERMAVLIQTVQGEPFGRYFFPQGAGVAFSRNLYRWAPQIRKKDGFVRLVWGLGTRAVERVGSDFPRLVALSHPTLYPDDSTEAIRYYSQQNIDLIDLQENKFTTLPVHQVLDPNYAPLRFIAQTEEEGYFSTPRRRVMQESIPRLAITWDELLRRTSFAAGMSRILNTLEGQYHVPIDIEFTVQVMNPEQVKPEIQICILQCRPQSFFQDSSVSLPKLIPPEDIVFSTRFMVPQGVVRDIRYVIFIPPNPYFQLPTLCARNELRQAISLLNSALEEKTFLCVGPGRWGTVNPDLGVFVSYSDVNNSAALVELSGEGIGPAPDPSLGTHFFQDLMEAHIYPLAICFDQKDIVFNRNFFYDSPNCAVRWLPPGFQAPDCVRLIDVASFRPGFHIDLIMDDEQGKAVAFLAADTVEIKPPGLVFD